MLEIEYNIPNNNTFKYFMRGRCIKMDLTQEEKENLAGVLLNHIGSYYSNVIDDVLEYDVNIYNKLTGEDLTVEYCREYIIGKE